MNIKSSQTQSIHTTKKITSSTRRWCQKLVDKLASVPNRTSNINGKTKYRFPKRLEWLTTTKHAF